ncbi:class I SAM-dependent methyltransferase [Lewinella sp. IMCC34183]|uniref:class I SAM-dependent methyltransferase n=1 Tax=Lewinella sp. IMCC34183 TaxID=2248762 RepID=UPI001300511F|nr:class I SAM-dependent methyltransferase [Lewinella sp. IMCC34183]
MEYPLISPRTGEVLRPEGDHFLTDGTDRWPVVDGIPYLRDKEAVRAAAAAALDAGDMAAARRQLLADQDRFSPTPPPGADAIDRAVDRPELSLREAMQLLNYGAVGDYFAYRWCSPTFTGGLHMLERTPHHLPVIEVACGIGHFLHALEAAGRRTVGVDIVWSKLWLARRYLGVRGPLICGDIERGPVLATRKPHTVFCHDALYFFEHKGPALAHMRKLSGGGSVAVGHVHTRSSGHAAGFAGERADYTKLTGAFVRDDADYRLGWYDRESDTGHPAPIAVGWIENETDHRPIDWTRDGTSLQSNPLLTENGVSWPSDGWRKEYTEDGAGLGEYTLEKLAATPAPASSREAFRSRHLLNLPARW